MFDVRIPAFCTLVLARVVVVEVYLPAVQDTHKRIHTTCTTPRTTTV